MKRICVFCGSLPGGRAVYLHAAQALGAGLAHRGIGLVYRGGTAGLMGAMANAALTAGDEVIAVVSRQFATQGKVHESLTRVYVVTTASERLCLMTEPSDGFMLLPGGIGTLEEFWGVVTHRQRADCQKQCGLLNIEGFYDGLFSFLDHAANEQLLQIHQPMFVVERQPEQLLSKICS